MGTKGPAPKPTALKKLQGNPGKRALNKFEPQPPISHRTPNAPDWLTEAAKEIWIKNARSFWQLKLLTELDAMAFGAFCEWMALFLKAKQNANYEEDVQTVMEQAHVSEKEAKKAIEEAQGDLAEAILSFRKEE